MADDLRLNLSLRSAENQAAFSSTMQVAARTTQAQLR
jgi:hypothetical protein